MYPNRFLNTSEPVSPEIVEYRWSTVSISFLVFITIVSLIGNSLVALAIIFKQIPRKLIFLFILHLAFINVLTACISHLVVIISTIRGSWQYDGHSWGCDIPAILNYALAGAYFITVLVITCDRLVAICFPIWYSVLNNNYCRKKCSSIIIVALTWVISISTSLSYIATDISYDPLRGACLPYKMQRDLSSASFGMVLFCTLILVTAQSISYHHYHKRSKRVHPTLASNFDSPRNNAPRDCAGHGKIEEVVESNVKLNTVPKDHSNPESGIRKLNWRIEGQQTNETTFDRDKIEKPKGKLDSNTDPLSISLPNPLPSLGSSDIRHKAIVSDVAVCSVFEPRNGQGFHANGGKQFSKITQPFERPPNLPGYIASYTSLDFRASLEKTCLDDPGIKARNAMPRHSTLGIESISGKVLSSYSGLKLHRKSLSNMTDPTMLSLPKKDHQSHLVQEKQCLNSGKNSAAESRVDKDGEACRRNTLSLCPKQSRTAEQSNPSLECFEVPPFQPVRCSGLNALSVGNSNDDRVSEEFTLSQFLANELESHRKENGIAISNLSTESDNSGLNLSLSQRLNPFNRFKTGRRPMRQTNFQMRMNRSLALSSFLSSLSFIMIWIPFMVCLFYPEANDTVVVMTSLLVYSNGAVTFLVYGICNKQIRQQIVALVKNSCCSCCYR